MKSRLDKESTRETPKKFVKLRSLTSSFPYVNMNTIEEVISNIILWSRTVSNLKYGIYSPLKSTQLQIFNSTDKALVAPCVSKINKLLTKFNEEAFNLCKFEYEDITLNTKLEEAHIISKAIYEERARINLTSSLTQKNKDIFNQKLELVRTWSKEITIQREETIENIKFQLSKLKKLKKEIAEEDVTLSTICRHTQFRYF